MVAFRWYFDVLWAVRVEGSEAVWLRRCKGWGLVWGEIWREAGRYCCFFTPTPSEAWGGYAGVVPAFVEICGMTRSLGLAAAAADEHVAPDARTGKN